jgi:hypothetical protein
MVTLSRWWSPSSPVTVNLCVPGVVSIALPGLTVPLQFETPSVVG